MKQVQLKTVTTTTRKMC